MIKRTKRPEVLTPIGGFAGLFSINKLKYDEPVLVSSTDGVGTKLKLAKELHSFKGIGTDLVAMCVNDLLCIGAEPLFFLDYYACGKLQVDKAVQVIEGMTESLAAINCALIGGETAEMPGVYQEEEFDLAGFSVGVVNRGDIIDGSGIAIGNKLVGLASSGVHSNGFSLVRKIVSDRNLDLHKVYPGFSRTLGEVLLEPTFVYVNPVLQLRKEFQLLGIAHITGGGLLENIPRVLPAQSRALIKRQAWPRVPIFDLLQEQGSVETQEMYRVFNCGIGMVLVVSAKDAEEITNRLNASGQPATVIGEIVARNHPEDAQVLIQE
ncbi:MAG: phosphoribosylformylglycinamidine cyclo-ligase [Deltaproteobacteria bacterium]|nr:phosphoribosylformylglycinamidine cyclo-ligase [Deltaproteobacteria bacterium]